MKNDLEGNPPGMQASSGERRAPAALPGFGHIARYWDVHHARYAARLLPGEFYVTREHEAIVTVLGSCVSACVRDAVLGIGGMNHFMLPACGGDGSWEGAGGGVSARYGSFAMEQLINEILKNGGSRKNLEMKVAGGGRILAQMTDIGRKNIAFIEEYARLEGIRIVASDVGDIYPRKVCYLPATGKMLVKRLRAVHNDAIVRRESEYLDRLGRSPVEGSVELF